LLVRSLAKSKLTATKDRVTSDRSYHLVVAVWKTNEAQSNQLKFWEIIADNLSKSRLELDWVSALDSNGRTIWIADAHRDDGKRFVVRADEKLTAFVELEAVIPSRSFSF
jgi:hypothetical protein